MYNRSIVQHGTYGPGSLRVTRCAVDCIPRAAKMPRDGTGSLLSPRTPNELVINHQCGTTCGTRTPLRHWQQLGFRNQLCRQSALAFEDLGQGLADAQEPEGIVPFLGRQCFGRQRSGVWKPRQAERRSWVLSTRGSPRKWTLRLLSLLRNPRRAQDAALLGRREWCLPSDGSLRSRCSRSCLSLFLDHFCTWVARSPIGLKMSGLGRRPSHSAFIKIFHAFGANSPLTSSSLGTREPSGQRSRSSRQAH